MEFRFNVNEVFKQPIVEINSSLIPPGLSLADKRALWDAVSKVSDVVNAMGEASATAQGLTKPITTSDRLRNSEHKLYLLIDQNANNGKGAVTGMLKTGKKGLYVFDRDGHHYQVQPSCVLDFYIHETKQRMGLGKKLFEHMLTKEQSEPVKMAIDRPSDKFLGFLNKHYSLNNPVRQMNNFVVFDGFFPDRKDEPGENANMATAKANQPANGLQTNFSSPYGRYGAPRPPCSMGQIIHNQSSLVQPTQETGGTSLNIRAPIKTRSAYVYSQKQPVNSFENQQVCQSLPNMWNQNNNTYNEEQQQMENGYYTNQTPNQIDYTQLQNQQYMQQQNYQQYQTQPQFKYNQGPYYPGRYLTETNLNNLQQPLQGQPTNIYPTQQQLNQQYTQMPSTTQQQYVSDTPQSNQIMPVQSTDLHLQPKNTIQFSPTAQTAQQPNYNQPTYSQSTHDQRYVQRPTSGNPTQSAPNVSLLSNQPSQPSIPNAIVPPQQSHQNPNQIQYVPPPNHPQNLPQEVYQQQPIYQHAQGKPSQGAYYQQQQPPQTMYQPQHPQPETMYQPQQTQPPQTAYQPKLIQPSQPVYQPQQMQQPHQPPQPLQTYQPQTQQQYPVSSGDIAQQMQQTNVQKPIITHPSVPDTAQPAGGDISDKIHPTQNTLNQQQNAYYQPQNAQYPANYQGSQPTGNQQLTQNQPPTLSADYTPPVPNITAQQQNTQIPNQMQYPQANPPSRQGLQRIDPSTIIPPVEALGNQNKNYHYYDSNTGRMQNIVNENVKQIPGNTHATLPNASGDMQPIVEN